MSILNSKFLDEHINTRTILDNINTAALIIDQNGKVARYNARFKIFMKHIEEGKNFDSLMKFRSTGATSENFIATGFSTNGLQPCRIERLQQKAKPSFGYFSGLRSQITQKPVAILIQIDTRASKLTERMQDLRREYQEQANMVRKLHLDSIHDPLTGLKNRRYMDNFLAMECELSHRKQVSGCLAILDIDRFKSVNDTYGHHNGDKAIVAAAEALKQRLRDSDVACRWGGEEFCFFLHNAVLRDAEGICEHIRQALESTDIQLEDQTLNVTASIGLTELEQYDTPESLFAKADKALYRAKHGGRNQTIVYSQAN